MHLQSLDINFNFGLEYNNIVPQFGYDLYTSKVLRQPHAYMIVDQKDKAPIAVRNFQCIYILLGYIIYSPSACQFNYLS